MNASGYWRASTTRMTGMIGIVICTILVSATAVVPVLAQDSAGSTPGDLDVQLDGDTAEASVSPTPVMGTISGERISPETAAASDTSRQNQDTTMATSSAPASGGAGAIDVPVLAQGLIYLTGADVVWQVRETQLTSSGQTSSGNARVLLQRSGVSIVRNDVTGKRARLEPGEAYFASAGDPYTAMADENSDSVVWIFAIANDNTVGDGAFYLSPDISGYDEAVYDFEFSRNPLMAGESATLPSGSGPYLLMVLSGGVSVTAASGTATLAARDGLVVDGDATVTASGDGPASYVMTVVGPTVSDASAAPPAPVETPARDTGTDTTGNVAATGETSSTQPEAVAPSGDASNLDPAGDEDNDYMTNGDEINAGLDPFDPDTDGDRLLDGQEWSGFGTDPLVKDSDGDGLIDGAEYDTYGTDPAVWDTDGDGAGDGDEVNSGTGPLDPASFP